MNGRRQIEYDERQAAEADHAKWLERMERFGDQDIVAKQECQQRIDNDEAQTHPIMHDGRVPRST